MASATFAPRDICDEIMNQVAAFSRAGSAPDASVTLSVIPFLQSSAALTA